MRRFFTLLLALLWLPIAILGGKRAASTILTQPEDWRYTDLRIIDPPEDSIPPACDLIAAYARLFRANLEVRLDVLKSTQPWKCDFYLAIRLIPVPGTHPPSPSPVPFQWDYLLVAPFGRAPYLLNSSGDRVTGTPPRVSRNSQMDTWVVRFNRSLIPITYPQVLFYAWSTLPDQSTWIDAIGPFALFAEPPQPASLVLLFWDTLPSTTPAQALRRWDGAHTGPYGQRHGLRYLLEAAAQYNIPLVLADLRHPVALVGLDAVGSLDKVTMMVRCRLISLPEFAQGSPQFSNVWANP